jgi:hypothetical protein
MKEADVKVLLTTPGSPFYDKLFVDSPSTRLELVLQAGGVPRSLETVVRGLRQFRVDNPNSDVDLAVVARELMSDVMAEMFNVSFRSWWTDSKSASDPRGQFTSKQKLNALLRILDDTARFQPVVKNLYDYGLLYNDSGKRLVQPVSEQARVALHALYAQVAPSTLPSLSEATTSTERGYLFERHVLAGMLSDQPLNMLMFRANSPDVKQPVRMDAVVTRYRSETDEALLHKLESHPTMRVIWKSKDESWCVDSS